MIRLATASDIHAIAALPLESERAAAAGTSREAGVGNTSIEIKEAAWRKTFADPSVTILVAADSDSMQGFAVFGPYRGGEGGEIHTIFVHPDHWRHGVGKSLLRESLETLTRRGHRTVKLWVYEENTAARRFYERSGFRQTGEMKAGDGARALLYESLGHVPSDAA